MLNTVEKKQLYIGGEWMEGERYAPLFSPYNGKKLADIPQGTEEDVDRAIGAAEVAAQLMRALPSHERAGILERLAGLLEERQEEAAMIIANEAAKPIKAARVEVKRTVQTYTFAAMEARNRYGETIPMDAAPGGENRVGYTVREPLGVIGAITPFNFPMNLVAHKIGPAIAAGNAVVLKPASGTPLSAFFLAELLEEAGLPKGACNVVTGSGRVVGDRLVKDSRVKMITFTGSAETGVGIRNQAGLKRVTLELGSNAALIVDEGVDLAEVAKRAVTGAFAYQGQVCISLQRIYVHDAVYQAFLRAFVAETEKLKTGDPLDPETDVSSLITKEDTERALSWVEEAIEGGAVLETGGMIEGNVMRPTVITNASRTMKVSCKEVFAPVVVINRIQSIEEGIEAVNDSRYGLQAGIFTPNIGHAFEAADQLQVGGVLINDIPTYRVDHMPYGGVKESGTGREGIRYSIDEMTEMKLIIINKNK
ncbi:MULTISPECIES: aldehyde dehydrogenase family protein [Pontibacillus]|uniref:Aldehyde dehydrogenase family protein n=1 Tax=Pontibacillus chungwhensis TaxID=265426 RepID=A0ABY8V4L2_9BACI|nr:MULTISPECIES: aldehyde dehydrogenase family protein [Pontibacillus]MCD5322150.1 aldehyde dehydrogenase family protein [Pontibacillus sp. HN14]WIG00153.1 aldehyde dehydrogenase family protein [Pontibacillus chungwhensis]